MVSSSDLRPSDGAIQSMRSFSNATRREVSSALTGFGNRRRINLYSLFLTNRRKQPRKEYKTGGAISSLKQNWLIEVKDKSAGKGGSCIKLGSPKGTSTRKPGKENGRTR